MFPSHLGSCPALQPCGPCNAIATRVEAQEETCIVYLQTRPPARCPPHLGLACTEYSVPAVQGPLGHTPPGNLIWPGGISRYGAQAIIGTHRPKDNPPPTQATPLPRSDLVPGSGCRPTSLPRHHSRTLRSEWTVVQALFPLHASLRRPGPPPTLLATKRTGTNVGHPPSSDLANLGRPEPVHRWDGLPQVVPWLGGPDASGKPYPNPWSGLCSLLAQVYISRHGHGLWSLLAQLPTCRRAALLGSFYTQRRRKTWC